jgi:hypothetical protein
VEQGGGLGASNWSRILKKQFEKEAFLTEIVVIESTSQGLTLMQTLSVTQKF